MTESTTSGAHVRLLTAADLDGMSMPEPIRVADGILPIASGTGVLLHGSENLGKTWIALDAAVAAAVDGHRSLLLLGEGAPRPLRDRLRGLAAGRGLQLQQIGELIALWAQPTLLDTPGLREVDELIEQAQPELIVVDPLGSFIDGDENDARDVGRMCRALRRWTDAGIAVVLVHHDRRPTKDGRADYRGSSALAAWADARYQVRLEGGRRLLHHRKERDGVLRESIEYEIEIRDDGTRLTPLDAAPRRGSSQDAVLDALVDGPLTKTRIRTRCGLSGTAVQHVLSELLRAQKIVPTDIDRSDTRGRTRRDPGYRLADTRTAPQQPPGVAVCNRDSTATTSGSTSGHKDDGTDGHPDRPL